MPRLIVTGPDSLPHEYTVTSEMTLGRNPGNDIQINEEKASRRHCRFRPQERDIIVEDLGSSNGTRVNGLKIQTYVLKHGDTITIGAHTIVFQDVDKELALAPSAPPDDDRKASEGQRGAVLAAIDIPAFAPAPPPRPAEEKAPVRSGPSGRLAPARASGAGLPAGAVRAAAEERGAKSPATTVAATVVAAVVVGLALVMYQRRDTQTVVQPEPPKKPPVEPPLPPPKPKVQPPKPGPDVPPEPVPPKPPDDNKAPADTEVAAAWTKALAERDRAIASGNYIGARAAIGSFLAAHPAGEYGQRAQKELAETRKLVDAALDLLLKDAQKAAADKNYRLTAQRCTRIAASDPTGKFGAEAREIMTRIDEGTEPRFAEVNGRATALIQFGQLDKASEALEKALGELGGTKWAEQIAAEQLQVLMARSLMRQLETERASAAAAGKNAPVTLPGKKLTGVLTGVTGLTLEFKAGLRNVSVPVKDLAADDLQAVLKPLNLTERHVELAYLWLLLEKTAPAQAEIERALQNPQQATAATRLVSLLPNQQNLHVYDFSKWQHQSDWDALSGSWSTQNDRYVLDSGDGGDTMLRPAAIGGPFAAKNAHISFDFELTGANAGHFFAFEFGSEDKGTVSAIFSDKGLALHANLGGAVQEQEEWQAGATHVDCAVKGDTALFTVNGKKAKPLAVPGLSALQGTITFRVREAGCAIDNVIMRNVEQ